MVSYTLLHGSKKKTKQNIRSQFIFNYFSTEITNVVVLQDSPFILITTQLWRRLLKQYIIITFHSGGGNKLPYLNVDFEMLMFLLGG